MICGVDRGHADGISNMKIRRGESFSIKKGTEAYMKGGRGGKR